MPRSLCRWNCLPFSDFSANIMIDLFFLFLNSQKHPQRHKNPRPMWQYFHHVFPSDWWPDKQCHCPKMGRSDTKTGNGRLDQPQPDTYGIWLMTMVFWRRLSDFHHFLPMSLWPSFTTSHFCKVSYFNGLVESGKPTGNHYFTLK